MGSGCRGTEGQEDTWVPESLKHFLLIYETCGVPAYAFSCLCPTHGTAGVCTVTCGGGGL